MPDKTDILILGATGFTGGLITRYLSTHPQRSHFTLAVGARSLQKLQKLVQDHTLPSSVKLVQVDVTKDEEIEAAVKSTRVVINVVGPYWHWGTPVVRACARNGVKYVDLTGEPAWIRKIILEFDYLATKTGAVIVPSCGFDSIPSDLTVYLSNKTLKSAGTSPDGDFLALGESTNVFRLRGGFSGGTVASFLAAIEDTPHKEAVESRLPYVLSPFIGLCGSRPRFVYSLPVPGGETIKGGLFFMAPTNAQLVRRTFGLLELQTREDTSKEARVARYGPKFHYEEFMATSGTLSAFTLTAAIVFGFGLMLIRPIRNIIKRLLPQPGEGPSDEEMQKGFFNVTNISKSASSPPLTVKSVFKGSGDPGYLLTAILISESALCFILPPASESAKIQNEEKDNLHALTPLAHKGGILTPMAAFGDELIRRLEETGRFGFSSSVIDETGKKDF
ncbi:Saccharopine dehydrogenase-domain-containing protein [Gymnopilus junonius]|uniref:Saccharopine dehydrogenase-domain-containing protein n=1 Tax=Gymnopilus junonius TaxID=109634 RepID=A0A9P5P0Q6_GYMJU|nr:Saccharopine dehydrogenase-domain-containing protein [Gymnopilus junonius]